MPNQTTKTMYVQNLKVSYGKIAAVKGLSFNFKLSQITTLIGSNGAGKTTTLKAIVGLVPSTGDILNNSVNLNQMSAADRLRSKVALCPEGRGIFPNLTVADNLLIGAYLNRNKKRVLELVEQQYALFPKLSERRAQVAGTLSGGEQQMLAISRALMSEPEFLLLDEPSLGLAPVIVEQIFEQFLMLKKKGLGLLIVEQNAHLALEVSDQAYVLETGLITLSGTGRELLKDSRVQEAYLA